MARSAVTPYSRKPKVNASTNLIFADRTATTSAVTQRYEFYDSAFLADRGCFTPMHPKRKPGNVRLDQRKRA
jgi:hypothetical protein